MSAEQLPLQRLQDTTLKSKHLSIECDLTMGEVQ